MIDLATAARDLVAGGWFVLPLKPGRKKPLGRLVPRGWHDASADPAVIERWWSKEPNANIGIACRMSGFVAIDFDPRDGPDDLHELEDRHGPLPETVRALTGSGGSHILLADPGVELVARMSPGIEVKSNHYIVAAPSLHPSGRRYQWEVEPGEVELAAVPEAWLEAMRAPDRLVTPMRLHDEDDVLSTIPIADVIEALTGRRPNRQGFVQCPFHGGGAERTPSLKLYGSTWACFACAPRPGAGRQHLGGGARQFAALLWDFPLPLRGPAFHVVQGRLLDVMLDYYERRRAA